MSTFLPDSADSVSFCIILYHFDNFSKNQKRTGQFSFDRVDDSAGGVGRRQHLSADPHSVLPDLRILAHSFDESPVDDRIVDECFQHGHQRLLIRSQHFQNSFGGQFVNSLQASYFHCLQIMRNIIYSIFEKCSKRICI